MGSSNNDRGKHTGFLFWMNRLPEELSRELSIVDVVNKRFYESPSIADFWNFALVNCEYKELIGNLRENGTAAAARLCWHQMGYFD